MLIFEYTTRKIHLISLRNIKQIHKEAMNSLESKSWNLRFLRKDTLNLLKKKFDSIQMENDIQKDTSSEDYLEKDQLLLYGYVKLFKMISQWQLNSFL